MATIVTRSGKGSPLTNNEVDANFTNLNTELGTKANTSSLATVATTGAYADLTGKPTIASADGSVVVTGTTNIDLSVGVAGSTSNVVLPIRNTTGATLAKGTAVYISGATGQISTVSKAIATGDATSAQTLGLVTANIANNSNGNVTLIGTITNIDTSAYTDGQQLYLSPTTAGTLTATKPYAPQHLVYVAVVEHAHPSQGKLFVKVQNGYEMDELHDVSAQNPANNDGLFYNTSTSLWEKKSIPTALGFTPYNATNPAGYITGITSGNVTTALGYTPANRAGDTFTGPITVNSGANQAILGSDGAIELTRGAGGAYIDFKDSTAEDFDVRLQASGNQLGIAAAGGLTLNGAGVLTGITSGMVTTALGYTPYNASNPSGYITSAGSISGNAATATNISNTGTVTLASATESNSIYATAPSYTADQPTKLLNFDWYGNVFSLGNIRSGSTPSSGFGVYYTPSGGSRAELMRVDTSGNVLINRTSASGIGKLNVEGGVDVTSANVTVQAGYGIAWRGDQSRIMTPDDNSYGALIRWGATGGCRLFESTTERLRIDGTGSVTAFVDVRAPIFYDSNDTGYFLDPTSNAVSMRTNGSWVTNPTSTWGGEVAGKLEYHNNRWYASVNTAFVVRSTTGSEVFWAYNTGVVEASSDFRAPVFYDTNNTAFYANIAGTSEFNTIQTRGGDGFRSFATPSASIKSQIYFADAGNTRAWNWQLDENNNAALWSYGGSSWGKRLGVTHNSEIYLRNSSGNDILLAYPSTFGYSSAYRTMVLGNQAQTTVCIGVDPIANASGSFNGNGSGVEVMFKNGVGFITPNSANNGYNLPLSMLDGYVYNTTSIRSAIFYDSNNTAYYIDPASGSNLTGQVQINGGSTMSGGWNRALYLASQFPVIVMNSGSVKYSGIGVDYSEAQSGMVFWVNGNSADITNGSATAALRINTGNYVVANDVRSTIFYDSNNSAYYVDPHSTSVLLNLNLNGGLTTNGSITVGNGAASSDIYMADSDEGTRRIHCNSNRIGFLTQAEGWGSYCSDNGDWTTEATGYASSSFRAPVFYDNDNTAYYINAASTSNLNKLSASGRSMVGSAQISMASLDANTWYPVTIPIPVARQTTLRIENGLNSNAPSWSTHPSGFSCYIEWTTNGLGWGTIGLSRRVTDWREQFTTVQIVGGITQMTNSSTEVIWLRGGANYFFSADCDVTPTIQTALYTSNGQTVEPRSTVFNNPRETATGRVAFGSLQTNEQSLFRASLITPDNTNVGLQNSAGDASIWVDDTYGNFYMKNVIGGFYGDFNNYNFRSAVSGEWAYMDGNMFRHNSSLRAPIFYDSNDTGYYLDPASTSRINQINYTGLYNAADGNYGVVAANGYFDTVNSGYASDPLELCYVKGTEVRIGTGGGNLPIKASAYYKGTDTAYFVDPSGNSTVNNLYAGGGLFVLYNSVGDKVDGAPWYGIGGNTGNAVQVAGYYGLRLRTASSIVDLVSDYAQANNSFRAPIFYDSNNTGYYVDPTSGSVLFGLTISGTSNKYLQIQSTDNGEAMVRYLGATGPSWYVGKRTSTSLVDTASFHFYSESAGATVGGIDVSGNMLASGSMRAPIFYDNNNTAYYVDPNSTSNLVGLTVANRISGSISGDAQRLFNHTGANNDGLQYWNTVGNDTLNPNTGWHYAIRMGHGDADTYYSATIAVDFFNDNVWLRRKGGGANQPWKRFALYENPYALPFYANVYYDADNSAYYLDASSTGTSLNVAGSIIAAGNVTAYSDRRLKNNIQQMTSALDKVSQLLGVTFTRNDLADTTRRYGGLLAQDVEKVLPEAVHDIGGTLGVDYNATIGLLVEAIKELRDEVEMLKK